MKEKSIRASEFDKKFEDGENIVEYLEIKKAEKPGLKQRRVSVDFPEWMVQELDKISRRLGVTRQSVIKVFISDKLKEDNEYHMQ